MNRADYATLTRLRSAIGLADSDTTDNALLARFIRAASGMMSAHCHRTFHPYVATHSFDYGEDAYAYALEVHDDLLEVTTLTNGDGVVVTAGQYVLSPRNVYPKWRLELKKSSGVTFTYSSDMESAITLSGVWGYHEEYPTCWQAASTLNGAIVSITATSVPVAAGTAYDLNQYVLCDSEQMKVTAIATNTLTVERGVNGTTAATHLTAAALKTFVPMADIEAACIGLATWLYRNRDVMAERIQFLDGSQIVTNEAPSHLRAVLDRYVKTRSYAL